jgi:hypothetical protein
MPGEPRRVKRLLVMSLVSFVLVWPALQLAIVRHTQSNPWHGFGMAMYAAPYEVMSIGLSRIHDGQPRGFDEEVFSPALDARILEYAASFDGLGLWAPREALLAELQAADPAADSFLVVPHLVELNPETGMLEVRKLRIAFEPR